MNLDLLVRWVLCKNGLNQFALAEVSLVVLAFCGPRTTEKHADPEATAETGDCNTDEANSPVASVPIFAARSW